MKVLIMPANKTNQKDRVAASNFFDKLPTSSDPYEEYKIVLDPHGHPGHHQCYLFKDEGDSVAKATADSYSALSSEKSSGFFSRLFGGSRRPVDPYADIDMVIFVSTSPNVKNVIKPEKMKNDVRYALTYPSSNEIGLHDDSKALMGIHYMCFHDPLDSHRNEAHFIFTAAEVLFNSSLNKSDIDFSSAKHRVSWTALSSLYSPPTEKNNSDANYQPYNGNDSKPS